MLAFAGKQSAAETDGITHEDVGELVFYGLQGMIDPPRAEAVAAIKACQTAGVRVKMITGDHAVTARAIAQQLGLDGMDSGKHSAPDVKTARDLADKTDEQLIEIADKRDRICPRHAGAKTAARAGIAGQGARRGDDRRWR